MPGRRPPPPIIVTTNFTQLKKVDNKSNQRWWKCNHCLNGGAGAHVKGQDNGHIKHLTDIKIYPNCLPEIQKYAHIILARKGVKDTFLDPITATPYSDNKSSSVVMVVKRKQPDTMDLWVIP